MKLKKIMSVLLASVMFMSIAAVPASALNYQDTKFDFYWEGSNRTNYTLGRPKTANTPVYIKATAYTLPYNGFYAGTEYANRRWYNASACSYLVNDYVGHVIRSNGTRQSMARKTVRIRGSYFDRTYNWGSVKGVWSPDTINPQNYDCLN